MNLALDLLRMAPSRFDPKYKKIYRYLDGINTCKDQIDRALKALYHMLIRKAKIQNLAAFIKQNDDSSLAAQKKREKNKQKSIMNENVRVRQRYSTKTYKTFSNR